MTKTVGVGIAGLGTVGAGVVELLRKNGDRIARRCGSRIEVAAVSARDRARDRGVDLAGVTWHDDAAALAADPAVDIVLELIGGSDGIARAVIDAAIAAGKPVVTANKALLALHGSEIAEAAEAAGIALAYEAAVAGGIPIVKAMREGLAANRISRVYGILNGTCNYILTEMAASGRDFNDILADAQRLGFAEADPTFDVEGIDAAHKLAILTSIAFGSAVNFEAVHIEGIANVAATDIAYARELGYVIKLLAIARQTPNGIEQRVHPCMVPAEAAIAKIDGVFNAVVADGDFVDSTVYVGRGAGAGPTASAVVADVIDIVAGRQAPIFGVPSADMSRFEAVPMARHVGCYYVRLVVYDRPGVIAEISAVLRDERISIDSLLQRGRSENEPVPVVMLTHETEEAAMLRALEAFRRIESVIEPPRIIRIEEF
ncbi:homoserine dehydrogenase [Oceanibacterium hippocampi]|uniref:Homoserine dehydrogenase n=1 Tax=Oceanibacterium hippocampi TaxID=745714 RepID=A0A1Y5SQE2_9PROT|nr:homoserine dehydrogenase [Oceanibacterium hippocampi]SLN45500.1 Homoserine dehydrogenase [Oceanibacterium hippocampi]